MILSFQKQSCISLVRLLGLLFFLSVSCVLFLVVVLITLPFLLCPPHAHVCLSQLLSVDIYSYFIPASIAFSSVSFAARLNVSFSYRFSEYLRIGSRMDGWVQT